MAWNTATVSLGQATKKSHFDQLLNNDIYLLNEITAVLAPFFSGFVTMYPGLSAPTGWLMCNGSAVSRTTYASLFTAMTTAKGNFTVTIATPGLVTLNGHGLITGDCVELTTTGALPTGLSVNTNYYVIYISANTFRLATSYANAIAGTAINTSGSQSGVHSLRYCPYGISTSANFLLPDFRGIFPRGAGTSGILSNANGTSFLGGLGAYQNDKEQGHKHQVVMGSHNHSVPAHATGTGASAPDPVGTKSTSVFAYDVDSTDLGTKTTSATLYTDGTNGTPRSGPETNPANLGINFIIKY